MKKCNIVRNILALLLVCNMIAVGSASYIGYAQTEFINLLQNKIDVLSQHNEELINTLENNVLAVMEGVLSLESNNNNIQKEITKLYRMKKELEKSIASKKDIDLKNVKSIKEANVLIKNLSYECLGSGTHIKINKEDYVLTCGHLIDTSLPKNILVIVTDNGAWLKATLVKYNKEKDLALLKVPQLKNTAYLEIGTVSPKEGCEVIVAGNPSGIVDMITDGIITRINKKGYYMITNKIWFGNSGGSLQYKGKLVGVISQILGLSNITPFGIASQNYGIAVSLDEIKTFLKEPNYENK